MKIDLQQDLQQKMHDSAVEFARQAGKLVLDHVGKMGTIEEKKNASDLVTEIDRMSEELLRAQVGQEFPGHWILSEENCGQKNAYEAFKSQCSGFGWIIDPIDGTTNFIHGIPHFAISIGIVKDGEPVIGVVYNPMTNELYTAKKSQGAYLNGKPIRVGQESKLTQAVLATGFTANDWKKESRLVNQIDRLAGKSRNVRINGAASLDLCWTATGRLTGFWHEGLSPWDAAAGVLILAEAGGYVSDLKGNPYRLDHNSLVATNAKIHEQFLQAIKF